jgi:hypothetical protein
MLDMKVSSLLDQWSSSELYKSAALNLVQDFTTNALYLLLRVIHQGVVNSTLY